MCIPLLDARNSQENGVRTRRTAIVNHSCVIVNSLLRVQRGPMRKQASFQVKICINLPQICTNFPKICTNFPKRFLKRNGSSKSLVLKSSSGKRTLWDSSLPVTLTLWDTPVLCTPPLPLSQILLRDFETIFGFMAHPPPGVYN